MFAVYVGHEGQKKNDTTIAVLYWHGGNYVDYKIEKMKWITGVKLIMVSLVVYMILLFYMPPSYSRLILLIALIGFQLITFIIFATWSYKELTDLEEIELSNSSIAFLRNINAEKMEELERLDNIALNPSNFDSKIHNDLKERRERILSELNKNDQSIKLIENKIKSFVKKKYNG